MLTIILIAARNLVSHRSRNLMLGTALAGVTTLMVVLLSLINGIERTMIENGTALATGHLNLAGFYKISQSSAAPVVMEYPKLKDYANKKIPEAIRVIDRVKAYGRFISDTNSIQVPVWGIDIDQEEKILGALPVREGEVRNLKDRRTAVIFESQAKKLEVKVNDIVTISMPTYRNIYNTMDVKIVAILKDLGLLSSFTAFINHQDAREIYQMKPDSTGQIMVYLKNRNELLKVYERARKDLGEMGYRLMEPDPTPFFMKFDKVSGESWVGQKIDVTTWEDETSFLKWIVNIAQYLTYFLTITLILIIVIGIMNSLWMSLRERTAEIGTLRAIGMRRSRVLVMFLTEALILSGLSLAVGSLVGFIICTLLNAMEISVSSEAFRLFLMTDHLTLDPGVNSFLIPAGLIFIFVTVGAMVPSIQAAKLKPLTAMTDTGV